MNNFFFGNTQSNGSNSGSHNTIINNYGTYYGGAPEPPKRGPSPLLIKVALVVALVAILALVPHVAPALIHIVPEILKIVFGLV